MSALSRLLPLIILFIVLVIVAVVGFVIYSIANEVAQQTSRKMEKKNVVLTKDGMRVGVKEVKEEKYVDKTQSMLIKAWNYSSWPAYKSRLGWNQPSPQVAQSSHEHSSSSRTHSPTATRAP
ncbi:hypothetical protein MMC20_005086 [Loxospora ochrophaea]|nr:hypothetical protein [Loxospora ochrophaea]